MFRERSLRRTASILSRQMESSYCVVILQIFFFTTPAVFKIAEYSGLRDTAGNPERVR